MLRSIFGQHFIQTYFCISYIIRITENEKIESNYFTCPSGVTQGSHLGPLFFLIHINNIMFQRRRMLLYGDNLKMFFTV